MEAIPTFNYEAFPLEQKHQWMQSGPGGGAAIEFGGGLSQLAADFAASDTNVGQRLVQRMLTDGWQGQASTAAGAALNRAATSLAGTATPGNAGDASSQRYGDSFTSAKNGVPAAPSVGENGWWGRAADELGRELDELFGTTFGVQSDYSKRLAAYRTADQTANDVLRRHEQTSRASLTSYQNAITAPASAGTGAGDQAAGGPGSGVPGTGGTGPSGHSPGGPGGPGTGTAGSGGPNQPGGPGPTAPPPVGTPPAGAPPVGRPPPGEPPTGGSGPTSPSGSPTAPHGPAASPGPDARSGPGRPGPEPAAVPPPMLPPVVGQPGGAGIGHAGGPGVGPLPARPGGGADASGGRGPGMNPEPGPAAATEPRVAAGPGSMPPGGFGAGGLGGERREHRNNVFIPDDEPFRVEFDDLAPPVIGPPDGS